MLQARDEKEYEAGSRRAERGAKTMSKDKKNKKKDKKAGKGESTLKALAKNPLVADIVASALVATASALKDSKRARALASDAADELAKLSKAGAKSGEALWDMALQIGRKSLETLTAEETPKRKKPKSSAKSTSKTKPAANAKRK
jgi:hypothetical protein